MTDDVFSSRYAGSYDQLYRDKDYEGECDFVEDVFEVFGVEVKTILDLGCGTGGHAIPLARRGYSVTGVDRSGEMLDIARSKAVASGADIRFERGDLRDLQLGTQFDAVLAMFAVMSYQTSNSDLAAACATARRHIRPGGVFCFDAWHGPGVLSDPPEARLRIVELGDSRLMRYTDPTLHCSSHTVETRFKLLRTRGDQLLDEVEERHIMRFLFPQEIRYYLENAGFDEPKFWPFPRIDREISKSDWQFAVGASTRPETPNVP